VVIIQPRKETLAQQNWLAFINQSYGCLADDPLERPEQPPLNEIDTLLLDHQVFHKAAQNL